MLDYRAWIIAGVILFSAAGAYLMWITRPRAVQTSRSLSAANHPGNSPSQPITKSLHVEGCNDDFIVKPGELVEPRVVPGSSLEQLRSIYGKETKLEKDDLIWQQNAYTLTASTPNNPKQKVHVSLTQGHVLETLDGIELGIDSFGAIFRKMGDKKVEIHERIDHSDGNWTLIVSLYPACGHKYRSEYSRTLPADPEIDRQINPPPSNADGKNMMESTTYRSGVFMNKVMSEYTMTLSNGRDDSSSGQPSEHY